DWSSDVCSSDLCESSEFATISVSMVSSTEPGYASRKSSSRCSRSTRVSPIGLPLPSLCTENRLRRGEDCTRDRGKRPEALPRHPAADRRAKREGKILGRKRIILDREKISNGQGFI